MSFYETTPSSWSNRFHALMGNSDADEPSSDPPVEAPRPDSDPAAPPATDPPRTDQEGDLTYDSLKARFDQLMGPTEEDR